MVAWESSQRTAASHLTRRAVRFHRDGKWVVKSGGTVLGGRAGTYMIAAAVADQAFSHIRPTLVFAMVSLAALGPAAAAEPAKTPTPTAPTPAPAATAETGRAAGGLRRGGAAHPPAGLRLLPRIPRRPRGAAAHQRAPPHEGRHHRRPDRAWQVRQELLRGAGCSGEGGEDRMPLKKPALPDAEIELIRRWIDQGAPLPPEPPPRVVLAPGGLKRLTTAQYHNTLRDLFGEKVALPTHLEPDTLVAGSATVGAARIGLSENGVEKFARAAFELAGAALGDEGFVRRFVPCVRDRPSTRAAPAASWDLRAAGLAPAPVARGGRALRPARARRGRVAAAGLRGRPGRGDSGDAAVAPLPLPQRDWRGRHRKTPPAGA